MVALGPQGSDPAHRRYTPQKWLEAVSASAQIQPNVGR
jgi:hypothetical protein